MKNLKRRNRKNKNIPKSQDHIGSIISAIDSELKNRRELFKKHKKQKPNESRTTVTGGKSAAIKSSLENWDYSRHVEELVSTFQEKTGATRDEALRFVGMGEFDVDRAIRLYRLINLCPQCLMDKLGNSKN